MPRFLLHAPLALALLAGGAVATVAILRSQAPAPELDLPGPRPVPVETSILSPRAVPRTVALVATLRAAREVVLAAEIGGRVDVVLDGLTPGAPVEAFAVLLETSVGELDGEIEAQRTSTALAQARATAAATDVERAEAALALSRESLEVLRSEESRWKDLVDRDRAERARLDLARRLTLSAALTEEGAAARLATARAAVAIGALEIRLSGDRLAVLEERRRRARVIAPFSGRFVPIAPGAPPPTVGTVLAPSQPIGSLVDVSSLRLVAEVHEDDVASLGIGASALARPISRPGVVLTGRVTAIGQTVDPLTRSVIVEAIFEDSSDLPAGTSARVVLEGEPLEDSLWIDERWIGFRGGRAVAFVVGTRGAAGIATIEQRPLELVPGTIDGGRLVRSGLSAGDEIVMTSIELLGDGGSVLPSPSARPAAARPGPRGAERERAR